MKKISIIIPVYNVAPYIERCLNSICEQTYKHIECILVDDCSKDNSASIIEDFINKYTGNVEFKLLHHKQNQGQATARNTGIRAATGMYIFFFDSDDAITPDCMETLIFLSDKYPEADFIQANTVVDITKDLMPYCFTTDKVPEFCNDKAELDKLILATLSMTVWNRLIKRSFIMEHHLFFPDGILCEDMYWIYFLAKEVNAASFTTKGTYLYYKNKNSDVNSRTWNNRFRHYQGQMVAAKAFYEDIIQSKKIDKYQRQYFAGNLVATMGNLSEIQTLKYWVEFWKLVCDISWKLKSKFTICRLVLFLSMMPPLCFLSASKGWMWRLKQYVVSKT